MAADGDTYGVELGGSYRFDANWRFGAAFGAFRQELEAGERDSDYQLDTYLASAFGEYRRGEHFDHRQFLDEDTVCWGNNGGTRDSLGIKGKRSVMLVALRLLHYLGFRTVYLLGADFKMSEDRGYAFDETRTPEAVRHNTVLYRALNRRFEALRDHFRRARFTVVNCTPGSGLTAFEHIPYDQAVERAAAECSKPVSTRGWYS